MEQDAMVSSTQKSFFQPVIVGMWMGIFLGYVEGVALCVLQAFVATKYVSLPIVWISPSVYAVAFGLLGLLISLLTHSVARLPTLAASLFLYCLLVTTDLLEIAIPEGLAGTQKSSSRWGWRRPCIVSSGPTAIGF